MHNLPATLLPALLELLPSGVVYYTPRYDAAGAVVDFDFAYLNSAAQRQLSLPAQPTVTYLQEWPGSVESGAWAFHRDTFLAGTPDALEQYYQDEDYTFNIQAHACRVEEGLLVTFADMAKQPRLVVEETLRQSHAREQAARTQQRLVATVFEQAPTAIWVVQGPDYVFELLNPLMAQLLGRSPEQALGRPYFEVMPELIDQGLPTLLRQAWQSGEPVVMQELPARLARHTASETGYFTFVFQPLRDEYDQVTHIACVAVDVTEQVLARQQVQHLNHDLAATNEEMQVMNEELSESNTQLLRTNADLDSFIYTASHDLRTPIANIEGLLNALHHELPAAQLAAPITAHLLSLMRNSISRFQTTIEHLTNVMQLQQAGANPAEEINVAELIEGIRLDLAPSLEEAGAQLHVDVAQCPHLRFAPKDLRSILFNLLSNAIKYRSPVRSLVVQLRTTCTPYQATLTVQDNGLGLTPGQQQGIFELFRRFHTHVEGTGVGLYSIKKLIDNARGTIKVESELTVGTTFTVTLPR